MVNAVTDRDVVWHASFAPGEFPPRWHDAAYRLHCQAWPTPWEGQRDRDRFLAELSEDHTDVLFEASGNGNGNGHHKGKGGTLLAYVKWKATRRFRLSRDQLSDPAQLSLLSASSAGFVCAYEITATQDRAYCGLGRRLLGEALAGWERNYKSAVHCTYSPKRGLTQILRRLAETQQQGRPALEAFAHRAAAVAARHVDEWVARLNQPLEVFIRNELISVPDEQMMAHLVTLNARYGEDVIAGVVAAMGLAYNFVLRVRSGQPACGPAAFHRALGAEHWRQYAGSATNCADALGLVDHWQYSHDPNRREKCARLFKQSCTARARPDANRDELIALA